MGLDWLPHCRKESHLINSSMPHTRQTRKQKPREGMRKKGGNNAVCLLNIAWKNRDEIGWKVQAAGSEKNVKIELCFENVQAIPPKGPQAEDV